MPKRPEISVVVPAVNEERYIGYMFEGLSRQVFRNFEVIVVDGNSTDKTRDIARANGAKVIIEKRRGIGRARNVGAMTARGRIIVFIDADTKPSPTFLEAYHVGMDGGVVAATGPILPLEDAKKTISLGYRFVSTLFVRLTINTGRPALIGSNFAVSKKAFREVHGFDVHFLTYEDWDLSARIGKLGKIKYIDDALVYTSVRRVQKWGVIGYFVFYAGNFLRYHIFKTSHKRYEQIR
jgi:glycosyltransferase involved in cell wall biosynthesis